MGTPAEPIQLIGYYSQPYNEIVHPDRVWRVPKYFLRRWGPYLSPSRFWAVVAARQFSYWNDKCHWFTVYDKRFAQEAQLSTIHFRRLKTEINEANQPISLFLSKKELAEHEKYHVVNGQTKPRPTTYTIRLDDPLTPADGLHLANWLQQQCQRQASSVAAVLREVRELPRNELLAPLLAPHLLDPPAEYRYLSVLNVIERVFGTHIAQNEAVKEEADILHTHLTGLDYYGKEYFRREWVPLLKPGPAFLLTYLRSLCFYDEGTGELRNEVTFTRPELAANLGVTTKTIVNWLKKLETAVPPQALSGFISLADQTRLSSNDVRYRYTVEMIEPLTKPDLKAYKLLLGNLGKVSEDTSDGKNDDHESASGGWGQGKNEDHDLIADGKNDNHGNPTIDEGQGKNEDHEPALMEKMMTGEGTFEQGSRKKRWPFKYYQTLIQTMLEGNTNTSVAADWSSDWKLANEEALQPFAQAACQGDIGHLFDLLGIDKGGPTRKRLLASGLSLNEMVAWYLYAASQKGLTKPPVHMAIARIQRGEAPPEKFLSLAELSWELWRCYACLLVAHPAVRDAFRQAPLFDAWLELYGRFQPGSLPFGVGEGVSDVLHTPQAGSSNGNGLSGALGKTPDLAVVDKDAVSVDYQTLWHSVLKELECIMTKATFDTWLKDSVLVKKTILKEGGDGQKWVVGVKNEQAVVWITERLNNRVVEPLISALYSRQIKIKYMTKESMADL